MASRRIIMAFVILTSLMAILMPSSVVTAQGLPVPVFGQRWDPWQWDKLGFDPYDTIHDYGCADTCIAMIHRFYGVNTDPRDMNQWLKSNGGFTDDYIVWGNSAGRGVTYVGSNNYENVLADLGTINAELDGGHPVIAEVRLSGHLHYVVITGHNGNIYYINDPWFGDQATLNGRYGSPAYAIYFIHKYRGPATNLIDSWMYRESSHPEVYVSISGGLLWIRNGDDVDYWGGWGAIHVVPDGSLHVGYGGFLPASGVMVRERHKPEVYLVVGFQLQHILTEAQVISHGGWDAVRIVPDGSLDFFQRGPDID